MKIINFNYEKNIIKKKCYWKQKMELKIQILIIYDIRERRQNMNGKFGRKCEI